jgi:2-polyprenyl-3-methyl-5-hydroxy-6-metoxy-1,4-benzoquinol methylase
VRMSSALRESLRTTRLLRRDPFAFARKFLARGAYAVRTGYWHTGERCCPAFQDEIFINQLKVYKFASQFCSGKKVLDVGCGTGYGTAYLANSAQSATGVDISSQAIRYARKQYRNSNLHFERMNAESLTFADGSFDFIVSTENFEHLSDHKANLRHISRVLTNRGTLLLATPNPEMFIGTPNPYHTHEFTYDELWGAVDELFSDCIICENLLTPPTKEGRLLREKRQRKGILGADLSATPALWGEAIDTTWLSNTHSFFCFARHPRGSLRKTA